MENLSAVTEIDSVAAKSSGTVKVNNSLAFQGTEKKKKEK